MPLAVLATGLLVTALSLFFFVHPGALPGALARVFDSRWRYGAALLRLLLGAGLIASAETVAFPGAVTLLGWLFVMAGLLLVVIPPPPLRRMTGWFVNLPAAATRLWLCLALALGFFLIYAAMA